MISENRSLELIYEGKNSHIYLQNTGPYDAPVVIKVLNAEVPSPKQLVALNNEYLLTKGAEIKGVREAVGTIRIDDKPGVVMTHFAGETLAEAFVATRQPLTVFLEVAAQIASILGEVHRHNIIHMDINSRNILVNMNTKEVNLIDFGLASRLTMRADHVGVLDSLSGTPAYISPEQTGRMNRNVDYRTDLYSLGVTFYEMLTGRLPFEEADLLAMVHAHMAKTPKPISETRSDVPQVLSDIVMRLLAKNAEDRYQSAHGLCADLSQCMALLLAEEDLSDPPTRYFELGRDDYSGRLNIPEKLYGRSDEIAALMASFERVSSGNQELLMVTGHPGVGKSATVAELHKPITEKRAYFISGKFDQYQQHTPYVPFKAAFDHLVDLLLAERDTILAQWREEIHASVGDNGAVLIEFIPSLEKILGPQPPIPQLDGQELSNRFNLTLREFLRAICTSAHPIVLFIDDWQWADLASLELLGALLIGEANSHLMLIGAYRTSEVDKTHPFAEALNKLEAGGVPIHTVHLGNLGTEDVGQLIQESLSCSAQESRALAELIHRKTDGNPFFARQFLQNLHEKEWLRFDFKARKWRWDVDQIQAQNITDNVAVLMIEKLRRLVSDTAHVLQRAACVGNEFDLRSLATVARKEVPDTLNALTEALDQGLVFPLDDFYKSLDTAGRGHFRFLHDRVQQAAYAQIPVHEQQNVQLEIGRLLLTNTPEDQLEQRVFDIVQHYNQAGPIIADRTERLRVADLNLKAADLACETAAFYSAKAYLETAIQMMPEDAWIEHYDLMLRIHSKFAGVLFVSGDYEKMDAICHLTEEKAGRLSDAAYVKLAKIQSLLARGELVAAIDEGLSFIEALGVAPINRDPTEEEALAYLEETSDWLTEARIASLPNLPEASVEIGQIMEVSSMIYGAVYGANINLFSVFVSRITRLCVEEGLASWSPAILATFSAVLRDIHKARLLTEVTSALSREKYPSHIRPIPILSVCFGGFVLHRYEHLRETIPVFEKGIKAGLATGNFHGASFCTWWRAWHHLFLGTPLQAVRTTCEEAIASCRKMQATRLTDWCALIHQAACNLEEDNEAPWLLDGEAYNEQEMLNLAIESNDLAEVFRIKFYRAWLCFLFDRSQEAAAYFEEAESYLMFGVGLYFTPLFHFYDALAAAGIAGVQTAEAQQHTLARISRDLESLEIWVRFSPMNHQHKKDLIIAEKARIEGSRWKAVTHYDNAIKGARKNRFTNEEALACELFGKFWLAENVRQAGVGYLTNAQNLYSIWGARAKIVQLKALMGIRYTKQQSSFSSDKGVFESVTSTRQSDPSGAIDLKTILKASQTLSQTVLLKDLLKRMIQLLLENAGAEKALILYRDIDEWVVLAKGGTTNAPHRPDTPEPLTENGDLSMSIFNYVVHGGEALVVEDASDDPRIIPDTYLIENRVGSVLCLPIHHKGRLSMVLYLENNLFTGAFTEERLELLQLLSGQMAISLENAMMVDDLKTSISKRKRAEASLRKYEHIVATSRDLMALINRNFSYEAVNDAYLSYHDLSREDIVGKPVSAIVGERVFEESVAPRLIRALAGESVNYQRHFDFEGSGRRLMDVSYFPFCGSTGEIEGVVVNCRDITETRRMEDQLIQAQKIESIGTLASGIAHDFNNILAGMLGFTELAMKETPKDSRVWKRLEAVLSGAERAKELVRQILAFSRQSQETRVATKISRVAKEALKLMRASLPSTIDIRTYIENDDYGVMADPIQVHQIFMNLCTNAHHAMGNSGGVLEVEVVSVELTSESSDRPHDLEPGDYVKATVRDNGHGMDKATKEKIFEPYFTTKQKGMGTGLGLAMVHGIMRKQGGAITVESEPGKGAIFSLYFPAIQMEDDRTTARKSEAPTGHEYILLVDDELPVLEIGRQILEHLGYRVETLISSTEALTRFKSNPDRYDLVITDLTMPKVTGDKLAEEIIRIRPDVPVILCTGYAEERLVEKTRAIGIRNIIMKPIRMNDLAKAVRKELDEASSASQAKDTPRIQRPVIIKNTTDI